MRHSILLSCTFKYVIKCRKNLSAAVFFFAIALLLFVPPTSNYAWILHADRKLFLKKKKSNCVGGRTHVPKTGNWSGLAVFPLIGQGAKLRLPCFYLRPKADRSWSDPSCCWGWCCWGGNFFLKWTTLLQKGEGGGVTLHFEIIVGDEPPCMFWITLLQRGGHTPFRNHSERWTTL